MTNKEKYAFFCSEIDDICIYDQPWWLDVDCGSENWDVVLYEKDGRVLGAMPFYIKKRFGLSYITSSARSQHHGAIILPSTAQKSSKRIGYEHEVMTGLIDELEKYILDKGIVYYQETFSPLIKDWLPFYWKGYSQTTKYTYRINDISDVDSVFDNFMPNKQKNIRKAIRAGITTKFDMKAEDFYLLHKEAVAKQGKVIKYSLETLKRYFDGLYSHNAGRSMYAVDKDGKVMGAILTAWDNKYGYHWISAFDPDTRVSGSSDLLVFEMIKYLSSKGITGFDFEGSMDHGIEQSCRSFGGSQDQYFSINKIFTKNSIIKALIKRKLHGR